MFFVTGRYCEYFYWNSRNLFSEIFKFSQFEVSTVLIRLETESRFVETRSATYHQQTQSATKLNCNAVGWVRLKTSFRLQLLRFEWLPVAIKSFPEESCPSHFKIWLLDRPMYSLKEIQEVSLFRPEQSNLTQSIITGPQTKTKRIMYCNLVQGGAE